ncbi:MAG TPA: alpha/beta fold hydrolase [Ideonella sp.]|nr:alpha/beta fold hydrolase [Ideonella sp.]
MSRILWRIFGVALMLTALALPLIRAPDRAVETLVGRWAPPPSDFIDVKGQLVHIRDEGPRGDPSPLVLLHGTSASLHTWEGWARALKGRHRVISLDLPGFGLTGPFAGQYTPDDYRGDTVARFVIDVLDHLQLPHATLAGNSLGGEIAWRVATLAPQRIDKLVLVDAAGYVFQPQTVPVGFLLAGVPVLNRVGEHVLPRVMVDASVRSVYGDPAKVTEALVDRYFELATREGNRRALRLRFQQMAMGEGSERIKTLHLPTLILWGGRDRLIPPAQAQLFARDIPGSRVQVFPGLGHVPQEEDPEVTAAAVQAFLGF